MDNNLDNNLDNNPRKRAAALATQHLPPYLGRWIATVLTQPHTLPTLIDHQNRIAADLLSLYTDTPDTPAPTNANLEDQGPNVEYPTSSLTHAPGPGTTESGTPTPLCPARSRRWSTSPTNRPVTCQRCLRLLAHREAAAGLLTDQHGQCGVCGDHPRLTLAGLISSHRQPTAPKNWCYGAGEPSAIPLSLPSPN